MVFFSAHTFYLEKAQVCLIGLYRRCYIKSKETTHKTVTCLQHQFKYFEHFCKLQNIQWHFQYMSVRGMFFHKWNKEPWCHFSFCQKHQLFPLFLSTKLITVYILCCGSFGDNKTHPSEDKFSWFTWTFSSDSIVTDQMFSL